MPLEKPKFVHNEIITANPVYTMHYFRPSEVKSKRPCFVVPPHAGRHGSIAQRMIDTCVANGRHTYTVELHSATWDTRNTSVEDLVEMLRAIQLLINFRHGVSKSDLICLCQGAWLGAVYTSKYQYLVNRYANFAGPINTKTGEDNAIEKYVDNWPSVEAMMEHHQRIVDNRHGIQPGSAQWFAFSMVKPTQVYFERFFDLAWATFDSAVKKDDAALKKFHRNNDWYDHTVDLAGVWFLDCLEHHFGRNELYEGKWFVGHEPVNLGNITCDVFLFAGDNDEITHPRQVMDMANVINSGSIYRTIFPKAGHTKVFVGTEELKHFASVFF